MVADDRTWIVIADGAKSNIVRYTGPDDELEPVPDAQMSQPNLKTSELVTDRRGRSFAGKGISEGRSAMDPPTDPHQHEESKFVASVADFLDKHRDEFDHLVVAAAPRALGDFRKAVSPNVEKKISAELNKNLTNMPLHEVREHLQGVLNIH